METRLDVMIVALCGFIAGFAAAHLLSSLGIFIINCCRAMAGN